MTPDFSTQKLKQTQVAILRYREISTCCTGNLHARYIKHTADGKSAIHLAREFFNLKWDALHNEWQQGHFGEDELNNLITQHSEDVVER